MAITEETEALMLAYVYGELSASDARAFERRLDADEELRAEVEGLRATRDLFGRDAAWGEASGTDAPPPHLVDAILTAEALARPPAVRQAALARAAATSAPPLTARLSRWLLGGGLFVGAAAAFLLVVTRAPQELLLSADSMELSERSGRPDRRLAVAETWKSAAAEHPAEAPPPPAQPEEARPSAPRAVAAEPFAAAVPGGDEGEGAPADEPGGLADGMAARDERQPPGVGLSSAPSTAALQGGFDIATGAGVAQAAPDPRPAASGLRAGGPSRELADAQPSPPADAAGEKKLSQSARPAPKPTEARPRRESAARSKDAAADFPKRAPANKSDRRDGAEGAGPPVAMSPAPAAGALAPRAEEPAPARPLKAGKGDPGISADSADDALDALPTIASKEEIDQNRAKAGAKTKTKSALGEAKSLERARQVELANLAFATGERELVRKNWLLALDEMAKAAQLDRDGALGASPYLGQMRAYLGLKRPGDAVRVARQLLKRDLKQVDVVAALVLGAQTAEQTGDLRNARELWSRLLEAPAERGRARAALDRLSKSELKLRQQLDSESRYAPAEADAPASSAKE
jgi:hypothetical protein